MAAPKGDYERKRFYSTAIHTLFAIVLGYSFTLTTGLIIPIGELFDPSNNTTASTLVFSYILIVSGWIGYYRSISIWSHKDTAWGAIRFVLDLIILFEYFYLLQLVSPVFGEGFPLVKDFPIVVTVIFLTYLLSDVVKHRVNRNQPPQNRTHIWQRTYITISTLLLVSIAMITYYGGVHENVASVLCVDAHILSIAVFTALVILYRILKWNLHPRGRI